MVISGQFSQQWSVKTIVFTFSWLLVAGCPAETLVTLPALFLVEVCTLRGICFGVQTHCGREGLLPVEYNCATVFCLAQGFCENVSPPFPVLYVTAIGILIVLIFNRRYTYCSFLDKEYSLGLPNENKCMVLPSHWDVNGVLEELFSLFCLFQTQSLTALIKNLS